MGIWKEKFFSGLGGVSCIILVMLFLRGGFDNFFVLGVERNFRGSNSRIVGGRGSGVGCGFCI